MIAVRVVKVAVHEVIDMIAVRNRFVTAAGAVDVRGFVAAAWSGAAVGVLGTDFDDVFIDVVAMRVMQVFISMTDHINYTPFP
jgi:hypothetical protein